MPTPREELNRLRALATQQPTEAATDPRQELEQLRALAKQPEVVDPEPIAAPRPIEEVRAPEETGLPVDAAILEPAATLVTGAIAEPIAGLAGIAKAAFAPSPEEAVRRGAEAVAETREALTFKPRTPEGQESLRRFGEALAPIGETLQSAEKFLGDEAFKATKSPALAAFATTLPTIVIEVLGLAGTKGFIKGASKARTLAKNKELKRSIVAAAPDIEQIKDASRAVYKELDDAGVTLRANAFKRLKSGIDKSVKEAGFDPDLTPKTASVLKRFEKELDQPHTLTEIDTLRKVAQNAAAAIEPADARLGAIILDNIDSFLDTAQPAAFFKGAVKASDVTPKFKVARELWGRARRSELINEAFEKAKNQASGFENGIVVQMRGILNNKKKARFFKPKEIKAMQDVVRGTTTANIAKLVGRLGFSEGHATNILGGAVGAVGGAALFGTPGAIAVPIIGQVSRKLAQRLTRKGGEFADIIVRAGTDADKIAKAYLSRTPKGQRSISELSELLARPDIALDKLAVSGHVFVKEAAEIAKGRKALQAVVGSAATLGAIKGQGER